MGYSFEFFIALRYLRAKRKEAAISVITVISVIGVAAGVMALIIGLAINNGFRTTLQRNLLGATAHVTVLAKEHPENGIPRWPQAAVKLKGIPHVISASPALYGPVLLLGPRQSAPAEIKGIALGKGFAPPDALLKIKGSQAALDRLNETDTSMPGIILGYRLAQNAGMQLNSVVTVLSPQGDLTPMGAMPSLSRFRVVGLFDTGFFELDNQWAFMALASAQKVLSLPDVVNAIELNLDDVYRAPDVAHAVDKTLGPELMATQWMEQNRSILNALRMEKIVTAITIGLIQLVGALNILSALVMLVMEKHRDIAILMSMGTRRDQIRRIFMFQGLLIGLAGVILGTIAGYSICYLADHYRWIRLDEEVYALSYVPFEPRWMDGLWIAGTALLVSFLATLYPARNATRITPVEVLRYE